MSCTQKTCLIERFLTNLLDENIYKGMYTLNGLQSLAIRPDSVFKTWNFMKENWNALYLRY